MYGSRRGDRQTCENKKIMKKILVIGSPGAGKSVFSRTLAEKIGLPLTHLDLIWHKSDRTHITREEFDAFLERIFKENEWIIDGNYSRTVEVRLKNADTVFFLDYPTEVCLEGLTARVGQKRADMPWVETELDAELKHMVENYPNKERVKILQLLEEYGTGKNIVIFHSRKEASKYLEELKV